MSDRKVLNKHYPADFDPSKIKKLPKGFKKKEGFTIRFMLPMSIYCTHCGNFMVIGTKFNAKKETVKGEEFYGLKIYRFLFKCNRCKRPITLKTDLENSDYACEVGAQRTSLAWREVDVGDNPETNTEQPQDSLTAIEAVEARAKANEAQLDDLDALEDLREITEARAAVDLEAVEANVAAEAAAQVALDDAKREAEEREEAERAFGMSGGIRRLDVVEPAPGANQNAREALGITAGKPLFAVQKKVSGLSGMLGAYDDESDSDDE